MLLASPCFALLCSALSSVSCPITWPRRPWRYPSQFATITTLQVYPARQLIAMSYAGRQMSQLAPMRGWSCSPPPYPVSAHQLREPRRITIIDHTGTYRQSPQGVLVKPSNDDSCIAASASASVVTQTVFMSGDGSGSEAHLTNGLDDKALLILSVCFGILAFGALALAVFLYSRLRQARRARMRGPRFPLVDEDFTHEYAGVTSREGSLPGSALGSASGVAPGAAHFGALANRRDAEKARENRHTTMFEKLPPSPDASHGE